MKLSRKTKDENFEGTTRRKKMKNETKFNKEICTKMVWVLELELILQFISTTFFYGL